MFKKIVSLAFKAKAKEHTTSRLGLGIAKDGQYVVIEQNPKKNTIFAKMHGDKMWIGWCLREVAGQPKYFAIVLIKDDACIVGLTDEGLKMLCAENQVDYNKLNEKLKILKQKVTPAYSAEYKDIKVFGKYILNIGGRDFYNLLAFYEDGIFKSRQIQLV